MYKSLFLLISLVLLQGCNQNDNSQSVTSKHAIKTEPNIAQGFVGYWKPEKGRVIQINTQGQDVYYKEWANEEGILLQRKDNVMILNSSMGAINLVLSADKNKLNLAGKMHNRISDEEGKKTLKVKKSIRFSVPENSGVSINNLIDNKQ